MRKIETKRMEEIKGGSIWDCIGAAVALGTVAGMGIAAISGNPLAIGVFASPAGRYAAATLVAGGLQAGAACID